MAVRIECSSSGRKEFRVEGTSNAKFFNNKAHLSESSASINYGAVDRDREKDGKIDTARDSLRDDLNEKQAYRQDKYMNSV